MTVNRLLINGERFVAEDRRLFQLLEDGDGPIQQDMMKSLERNVSHPF